MLGFRLRLGSGNGELRGQVRVMITVTGMVGYRVGVKVRERFEPVRERV